MSFSESFLESKVERAYSCEAETCNHLQCEEQIEENFEDCFDVFCGEDLDHITMATHVEFFEDGIEDFLSAVSQDDFESNNYGYGEPQRASNLTYFIEHWFIGLLLVSFIFMHMLSNWVYKIMKPYGQGGFQRCKENFRIF